MLQRRRRRPYARTVWIQKHFNIKRGGGQHKIWGKRKALRAAQRAGRREQRVRGETTPQALARQLPLHRGAKGIVRAGFPAARRVRKKRVRCANPTGTGEPRGRRTLSLHGGDVSNPSGASAPAPLTQGSQGDVRIYRTEIVMAKVWVSPAGRATMPFFSVRSPLWRWSSSRTSHGSMQT